MINQAYLPYRHTEKLFRFYEPLIAKVLNNHPKVTILDPRQYQRSLDTFTARLRDAMHSFSEYKWSSTQINYERFKEIRPYLKVAQKRGLVYVGTQMAITDSVALESSNLFPDTAVTEITLDFFLREYSEFKMLCILAHQRAFKGPLTLTIPPGSATEWAKLATESYDVIISPGHSPGQIILT